MNTENVKIRIFDKENKTTLTIKRATKDDDATYVCKATSEIGMITTKAKLHIDIISDSELMPDDVIQEEEKPEKQEEKPYKKKKTELKKAKEIKEKIKAERIKIEKEEIQEEKLIPKEQTEEKSVFYVTSYSQYISYNFLIYLIYKLWYLFSIFLGELSMSKKLNYWKLQKS